MAFQYFSGDSTEKRAERAQKNELIDEKYGFVRHKDPVEKVGWLINMHPVSIDRTD